jgi:predicted RNase H-like nuclease (RuvC/YqgF family)
MLELKTRSSVAQQEVTNLTLQREREKFDDEARGREKEIQENAFLAASKRVSQLEKEVSECKAELGSVKRERERLESECVKLKASQSVSGEVVKEKESELRRVRVNQQVSQ